MKTYSEFLRESTIVEGASIIRAGSRKKSSYRGPTGDHKRDEHGHIVASHYNKTKTEYPSVSPKKGKKKKGPIDWQKTKKNKKKAGSVVQTKSGKKVNSNYEKLKAEIYARDDARKKKNQEYAKKHNPHNANRPDNKQKPRKWKVNEDAPTMSVGTGGFTAAADAKGPVAGYDPLLKMMNRWKKAKTYPNKMADVVNRGRNGR